MRNKTRSVVMSAMFAALICVATMIIKIQLTPNGYINFGDGTIILASRVLGGWYGFFAAAIGSMLADLLSGFAFYAPATFLIKGFMAVAAYFVMKKLSGVKNKMVSLVIASVVAELVMIIGYGIFEAAVYGIGVALASMLGNSVQAIVGIVSGVLLIKVFEKSGITA